MCWAKFYVYVCISVCVCVYMCISVCVHVYVCISVCVYVYVYMYVYVDVYVEWVSSPIPSVHVGVWAKCMRMLLPPTPGERPIRYSLAKVYLPTMIIKNVMYYIIKLRGFETLEAEARNL